MMCKGFQAEILKMTLLLCKYCYKIKSCKRVALMYVITIFTQEVVKKVWFYILLA
jgi:hypothetical protein